jgi:hypothetical protein
MKQKGIVRLAVAAVIALSAASALGASDYLLEIKGVEGESGASGAPQAIEISSFSWGTSNPTSVGSSGMSAGKVSMQDMSVMAAQPADAQTAREAGSGMATGKQASAPAAAAPPKVGDVATFTATFRESPTRASTGKTSRACTPGEHIKDAVLTVQGKRYEMHDVVVTSCTNVNGQRRGELTGHVTLIK